MRSLATTAFLLLATTRAGSAGEGAFPFRVIVHAQTPVESVDRKFLADAFFKRITQWPENGPIHPVDLAPDSPVRRKFSEEVLRRSVPGIKNYWQQLIFSGRGVPPPELRNEEEVIRYVSTHPGSLGYVSSDRVAEIGSGVKTVGIADPR